MQKVSIANTRNSFLGLSAYVSCSSSIRPVARDRHAWAVKQTDGRTWAAAGLQCCRTAAIGGADIWRERVSRLKTPAKDEEAPASSSTPSRHLLAASSGASPLSAATSASPFQKQAESHKDVSSNDGDALYGIDAVTSMGHVECVCLAVP